MNDKSESFLHKPKSSKIRTGNQGSQTNLLQYQDTLFFHSVGVNPSKLANHLLT